MPPQDTPPGPNPSGLCQCGCGQPTKLARNTDASRGIVQGAPQRFIYGHHLGRPFIGAFVPANPTGLCLCGCGERTPLAKQSDRRKGWIKGQPVKYLPKHDHAARMARRHQEYRVEVDRKTGCWNWLGSISQNGYGQISRDGKTRRVHRIYYEKYLGPIPDGLVIDHLCRNRRCCNPAHLEAVTAAENVRRGWRSPLTEADLREIKRLRGAIRRQDVAARFGIDPRTVQGIWDR